MFPNSCHLCQRIPRNVLEAVYGINLTSPLEEEDPNRAPLSDELLSAYGCKSSVILCLLETDKRKHTAV